MKNTTLILTPENKNYLISFLGNYLIECNDTITDTPKRKLVELLNHLIPDEENK